MKKLKIFLGRVMKMLIVFRCPEFYFKSDINSGLFLYSRKNRLVDDFDVEDKYGNS